MRVLRADHKRALGLGTGGFTVHILPNLTNFGTVLVREVREGPLDFSSGLNDGSFTAPIAVGIGPELCEVVGLIVARRVQPVSYTKLTLPTTYSV